MKTPFAMNKRQDIELLRIMAAFAIVWYHSSTIGGEISYAGLIVFLMLSMYLAGRSTYSGSRYLFRRTNRLLIPWAVWFLMYGAKNALTHKPIIPTDNGIIAGILTGPSIHLWYMPFIFACLILFDSVRKYASSASIAWASAALTIVVLGSTALWRQVSIQLGCPIAQYAHASAGISLGAFFAFIGAFPGRTAALLLVMIFAAALSAIPFEGVGIPYVLSIAAGCMVAFRIFEKAVTLDFGVIAECTLGIYFVHILVFDIFRKYHIVNGILTPVAIFFLSACAVFLMRRSFPRLAKYWS